MSGALFEAVCEHAEVLGMDPVADRELLWIAERSLNASLPEGWHSELDETHQTPYYFSDESEVPQWEHPRDEEFRALFLRRKAQGPPFEPDDAPVADFLLSHPAHRHSVRRIQNAAPYSEIRDNTIAKDFVAIDMLRAKLSFFGATRFDPRSDRWVRICMFAGAPYPTDLCSATADRWVYADGAL